MEEKDFEQFLENIGYSSFPDNREDLDGFFNAIVDNLGGNDTYRFLVTARHPKYIAPRLPMNNRRTLIDLRKKFQLDHTTNLREYFDSHEISYPDMEIGFTFPVDLTSEQARNIRSSRIASSIFPDHPRVIYKR